MTQKPQYRLVGLLIVSVVRSTAAEKPVQTLAFDRVTRTDRLRNSASWKVSLILELKLPAEQHNESQKPLSSADSSITEQIALASSDYSRAACVRTWKLRGGEGGPGFSKAIYALPGSLAAQA